MVSRGKIVLVLLEVAGHAYGLPIAVVQDALKLSRTSQDSGWQLRRAATGGAGGTGTIEVDGRHIPLVDLRVCLGLPKATAAPRSRTVLVIQSGEHWLGLLVDAVAEIVEAPRGSIEASPCTAAHQAIGQVAHLGDRTIDLLDADRLLPAEPAIAARR
jgi:purine-binding chemotaxis protein CheW